MKKYLGMAALLLSFSSFSEQVALECESDSGRRFILKADTQTNEAIAKYYPAAGRVFPLRIIDTNQPGQNGRVLFSVNQDGQKLAIEIRIVDPERDWIDLNAFDVAKEGDLLKLVAHRYKSGTKVSLDSEQEQIEEFMAGLLCRMEIHPPLSLR